MKCVSITRYMTDHLTSSVIFSLVVNVYSQHKWRWLYRAMFLWPSLLMLHKLIYHYSVQQLMFITVIVWGSLSSCVFYCSNVHCRWHVIRYMSHFTVDCFRSCHDFSIYTVLDIIFILVCAIEIMHLFRECSSCCGSSHIYHFSWGYDFTRVKFPIFLLIFAWVLQQCSVTALPVIHS